jgi:glycosyltransferase involved in cell wall biosynthesis
MKPYPRVDVLLATYNGGKFLKQLLKSLENQEGVSVSIFVNDDGSTDDTLEILNSWKMKGIIKSISFSEKIGPSAAFDKMLSMCQESDYVAFCDQDDEWKPTKLKSQIRSVGSTSPILVFSPRSYIDENSVLFGRSMYPNKGPSFANALVENIAPGNTILLNKRAVMLINQNRLPQNLNYDSWIYLLLSAFGKCIYVNYPLVDYRIHASNAIGLRKINIERFIENFNRYGIQAAKFNQYYQHLLPNNEKVILGDFLEIFTSKSKKAMFLSILKFNFARQSVRDSFGMKIFSLVACLSGKIDKQ